MVANYVSCPATAFLGGWVYKTADRSFMSSVKPFSEAEENYVRMHKILFDSVMPNVSSAAWKVLSLVVRKTIGWQKKSDLIAQSQIVNGTGIKSRNTIRKGIQELVDMQILNAYPGERRNDGHFEPTEYSLNLDYEVSSPQPCSKIAHRSKIEQTIIPNNTKSITSTMYLEREEDLTSMDAEFETFLNVPSWVAAKAEVTQ